MSTVVEFIKRREFGGFVGIANGLALSSYGVCIKFLLFLYLIILLASLSTWISTDKRRQRFQVFFHIAMIRSLPAMGVHMGLR